MSEKVIFFHPKTKNEFDAIITIAESVGVDIKTNFTKINKFPYIVIVGNILSLSNTSIKECDRHGLNRKDFHGIIRYLIQRKDSQFAEVWKYPEQDFYNCIRCNKTKDQLMEENNNQLSYSQVNMINE